MITSAGYDRRCNADYDWHGLRRGNGPFVLMQHTLSGRGKLRHEGREHQVGPDQTLLLRIPHDNRYWPDHSPELEFFWLCLNGREMVRLWREMLASAGPLVELPGAVIARLAEFLPRRGTGRGAFSRRRIRDCLCRRNESRRSHHRPRRRPGAATAFGPLRARSRCRAPASNRRAHG